MALRSITSFVSETQYVALQQLDMDSGGPSVQPTGPEVVLRNRLRVAIYLGTALRLDRTQSLAPVGNKILIKTGILGNFDGGVYEYDTQTNELSEAFFNDADYGVWF